MHLMQEHAKCCPLGSTRMSNCFKELPQKKGIISKLMDTNFHDDDKFFLLGKEKVAYGI